MSILCALDSGCEDDENDDECRASDGGADVGQQQFERVRRRFRERVDEAVDVGVRQISDLNLSTKKVVVKQFEYILKLPDLPIAAGGSY